MTDQERQGLIEEFKVFFRDVLANNHKKNTLKLIDINEFQINPLLLYYLSSYLEGNTDPESLAKVLVYPRVLGTSITTSFGTGMQWFITRIMGAYGSTTSGIDIEFIDQLDGRKKFCQLKSGPNALNKDDITTIDDHFKSVKNLARTNNLKVEYGDLVFCLIYGERKEVSSFIRALENKGVVVLVGKEFWHHFTGDEHFYRHLILAASEVAKEVNMKEAVNEVIVELSKTIDKHYQDLFGN
jgi:hypothetical protein